MPKAGYITFRVSQGRRHALDAIRIALRFAGPSDDTEGVKLTDSQCLDFALDWCLASLPERLTVVQARGVLARLNRHGWLTQANDDIELKAHDMSALADRVKETHGSWSPVTPPSDYMDPRDGHPYQAQEGNGCELCGLDIDQHPMPF